MEIARRLGLLPRRNTPEIQLDEVQRWEEAYLGKTFLRYDVYTTLLTRRDDPHKKAYASLIVEPDRVSAAIPLIDFMPQEKLAKEASLKINEFIHPRLLALFNKREAGVSPPEIPQWFFNTFDVKHLQPYGDVFIGSFGGWDTYGFDHSATIECRKQKKVQAGLAAISAADFAQVVRRSLPHIDLNPLPIGTYLQTVQSTLKFLPNDWETSYSS